MRVVLQRVSQARVEVDGECVGSIGPGLLILLAVTHDDTEIDAEYLAHKITYLRVFEDSGGKMNLSVRDIEGGLLVVSQFTLYGKCTKGRRPSFDQAAATDLARRLYEHFISAARSLGLFVATGVFQSHMLVSLTNDGPVTLVLDSKKL